MPVFITFLSDFGTDGDFAGICHGVIARVCPEARVIDISHGIRPTDVGQGARLLASAIAHMPVGVHLCVVDPGVGSQRRAVALRSADGRLFVGPDNGLMTPAADACGGVVDARAIDNPDVMLHPVSSTFHGRDVFAPAAARLAGGLPLERIGTAVDPDSLVRRNPVSFRLEGPLLEAVVVAVDRFGNIQLGVSPGQLGSRFETGLMAEVSTDDDRYFARCAATFADVEQGELVLYEDSSGLLSLAINRGDAAELTAAAAGSRLTVNFDPPGLDEWPPA